jgi:SOS-response transcriptional repressor LexA
MISSAYYVLQAEFPGGGLNPIGLLLEDPTSNQLHLRLRRDLETLAGDEDAEVLLALAQDLKGKAAEMGAAALLRSLEDSLSNAIQITDRQPVQVGNFEWSLNQLFREHVPTSVRKFETHVPVYSLRAAAGKFLENDEIQEEGWEEIPASLRRKLDPDLFAAHIAGHSMEPQIPDGSLCLFRANLPGSREGKLVLAQDCANKAFAIKRYQSEKNCDDALEEQGSWSHRRIHLISLNPAYDSWYLTAEEDKYRILAEFLTVLG